jgi:hypothetical protein
VVKFLYLVGAVALAGVLDYGWSIGLLDTIGLYLGLAMLGLIGGLVLRSWWSLLAAPGAVYLGSWIGFIVWRLRECAECAPWNATPLSDLLIYGLRPLSVVAIFAVVGTLARKHVAKRRRDAAASQFDTSTRL